MARKTQPNSGPLTTVVIVEWNDAASYDAWDDVSNHETHADVVPMVSIGFLLKETKDAIRIARSAHLDEEQLEGVFAIPKGMVTKMVKLPRKALEKKGTLVNVTENNA